MAQAKEDMIEITRPSDGAHVDSTRPLVASGRADRSVVKISGECRGEKDSVEGILAFFALDVTESPPCYRWTLLFNLPAPGRYQLSVGGETATHPVEPVTIGITAEGRAKAMQPFIVHIDSHSDGDNITSEKDDFTPYGLLTERPLGVVTMTDSHGGITYPDATFSDHVVLQFWSATFPPLSPETYTLYVADSIKQRLATLFD